MVLSLRAFAFFTVIGSLCWPVSAQSQTPTNPYPNPYYSGGGYGSNQGGYGYNQSGYGSSGYGNQQGGLNSPLGTSTLGKNRGTRSNDPNAVGQNGMGTGGTGTGSLRDRHKRSSRNEDEKQAAGKDKDKEKAPDARAGAVGKAAADAGPGKDTSKAATATGPKGGGAGATGGGGAGGGGTTYTKGEPGTVSVSGEGAFEPILERDVEYGEVPDEGEAITLEGPMAIGEFLSAINLATNWNVLVSPELQDVQLKFWISETPPKKALEILKFYKVYYEYDADTKYLRVMSEEDFQKRHYGKRKPKEFRLKNIDVTFAESMITALLSATGRTVTDQRSGVIYVWDTQDNIDEMDRIIQEIDVPLERAEFKIKHADVPDIESVLSSIISPNGNMMTDTRTGQVFVWDSPSNVEQMRMAVKSLDQPVESRTFELLRVNAEDVTDSIESLLTERGSVQVDPRTNTVIVTDLPSRIDRIAETIKTLDRELETRTWTIKYADLDFIADEIETLIPAEMGSIIVNEQVNQVTVTGVPARLEEIDKLIATWDIKRRQVHIESFIVEVSNDVERAFSINWSYFNSIGGQPFALSSGTGGTTGGTGNSVGTSGGSTTGATTSSSSGGALSDFITGGSASSGESMQIGQLPYGVPLYGALQLDSNGKIVRPQLYSIDGKPLIERFAGNNLPATLEYLDRQEKVFILSSPRVTVQDGEEASFQNASRVPYVSASTYYGGYYGGSGNYPYSGTNNTNRVEFIDVGTILTVLPRIANDDTVLMDISAEDSTYVDKVLVVNDQKSTVPEKTVRRADTQVRVNSGDTVVLGGLRKDRTSKTVTKTPLLGDLPAIGWLFRSPDKEMKNGALLIFITPTIVDENTSREAGELMRVDSEIAKDYHYNKKDIWQRGISNITGGQNEVSVSIGATGKMYSDGTIVTMDELGAKLQGVKNPKNKTLVIRKHPTAPLEVVNGAAEAAMELGMRVEYETNAPPPIVPSIGGQENDSAAVAPKPDGEEKASADAKPVEEAKPAETAEPAEDAGAAAAPAVSPAEVKAP